MASSGNFSTFNPLNCATTSGYGNHTFANGNTQATASSTGNSSVTATIATGNSGKYYAEFYLVATPGNAWIGYCSVLQTPTMTASGQAWVPNANVTWSPGNLASYFQNGYLYKDGSSQSSWGSTFTTGDIIQIAIDADNDAVYYGKNNTWQNSGNPESGSSKTGAARTSIPKNLLISVGHANGGSGTVTWKANFGQDSTFNGTISAGGNADANGFGDFKYAPPSGYVALSTANLPISDDIDPAQTDDNIGEKQVNAVTYTGNGSSVNVTGFGFAPDFVWIKSRSPDGYNNMIFDSSRGVHKHLSSDRSSTEFNTTTSLTSFDSDGFTYGSETSGNDSGDSFMSWGWRANGGTTATNNDGSVTSTVQANQAAGFSIVTFTGINSATTATVGHGLGKAPTAIMHFCRTRAAYPFFRIKGATNASTVRSTNPNGSPTDVSGSGGALSDPTSSVFSINNYTGIGGGGEDYVAYCWAPIEGYSKFGNFTGNGNADGPFIYTGFRPKIVVLIAEPYGRENFIYDTTRDTANPIKTYLRWGRTNTESSSSAYVMDFLSNGFKIRGTFGGDINGSDENNFYMCWGDVPFKYNNTF